MNTKQQQTTYCSNCGKYGHIYKHCTEAVTSYGIILYKLHHSEINYLLIRRKDSLTYVEFIRGRYNINNIEYIYKLINGMTCDEKKRLLDLSFEELWNCLWTKPIQKQHKKEYNFSQEKFYYLKNTIEDNSYSKSILFNLIHRSNSIWNIPEWGFPKGRRNLYENDLDCAEREFIEETGLKKSDFMILKHINPVYEVFTGSNNIKYKHIYYIAISISDIDICINNNNKYQIAEIGDIGWFNFTDSINNIRPTNPEKRMVLSKANNIIKNLCAKN